MFRFLLVFLFAPAVMFAGSSSVPEQLRKNFEKIYPYVTDAQWSSENNNYVVKFTLAARDVKVYYDAAGNMIETSMVTNPETLPSPVLSYVSSNFSNQKIRRAEKVTDSGNNVRWRIVVGKDTMITCDETGSCSGK